MPNYFSKNTTPQGRPFTYGRGAMVQDSSGKQYIDLCAQTLNLNLGQCHPQIIKAVDKQLHRLTYASSRYSSDVAESLSKLLINITPSRFKKVNLKCISGSDANECALKMVRKKTGKNGVVTLLHSHHGQTIEAMRISGKNFAASFLGERHNNFIDPPYCFRCPFKKKPETCSLECLGGLEKHLKNKRNDIAAVFIEPIMVDAGVITPPRKYHIKLRELCNIYKVALVYDEVQTAFGWLGTMFAMDYYKVEPDILTLAKGLGAGFPLGAVIMSKEYDVLTYGEHEMTYGAHPISCTAAKMMINILKEKELAKVIKKSKLVEKQLKKLASQHKIIGDVRGVGLLRGIEIVKPDTLEPDEKKTKWLFKNLLRRGFILRMSKAGQHANVLQFKPPLIITTNQLYKFFKAFDQALTQIE